MTTTLLVHIAAGGTGLLAGYVALYAAKGERLHRRSGMTFVCAMLVTCAAGVSVAVGMGVAPALNVPAGVLTAYLVVTGLATVRPPSAGGRWLDRGALLVALAVGAASLAFGVQALANGGMRNGLPAFPFFLFGVVGVLAAAGDLRMIRSGPLRGARRVARHLWRMSFALFVAALSFFVGQAKVIPEPLRVPPLLALPVVAVLATMAYWLWRLRPARGPRGEAPPRAAERGLPLAGVRTQL
jgi:hypothetical protein